MLRVPATHALPPPPPPKQFHVKQRGINLIGLEFLCCFFQQQYLRWFYVGFTASKPTNGPKALWSLSADPFNVLHSP